MTDNRVVALLRHHGEILVRRADGRWKAITGTDATDPSATARRRVRAETGLSEAATAPVRVGAPVDGRVPVLVDAETRQRPAPPDGYQWITPPTLLDDGPPWLWETYEAVRPIVATLADDTEHGSSTLSVRALETLRDEAALAAAGDADPEQVRTVARELLAARPAMAVVTNRVNRAMDSADPADAASVATAAHEEIQRAVEADRQAAANAAERIVGRRVATLSRSGTVLAALAEATTEAVLVATSRPGGEGVAVAEALAADHDVTVTTDAAFPAELTRWDADVLLVGADTVLPDGGVRNKVGTYPAAAVAARDGVPALVATATDKVSPDAAVEREPWPGETPYAGEAAVAVSNPTFDVTPAACIDEIVTERGRIGTDAVASVAAAHRARARWDDA